MSEKVLKANLDELGIERTGYLGADEWTEFGGVQTPTFLVTEENYKQTLAAAGITYNAVDTGLMSGVDSTDAGDMHGQYHNEIAWYRTQLLEATANEVTAKLEGFDRAVIIPDYKMVRAAMVEAGFNPSKNIILGSQVTIQYNDDPTDTENIQMVSKLDGGFQPGWVSVSTPLAQALSGKIAGETVSFKVEENRPDNRPVKVKILEIS